MNVGECFGKRAHQSSPRSCTFRGAPCFPQRRADSTSWKVASPGPGPACSWTHNEGSRSLALDPGRNASCYYVVLARMNKRAAEKLPTRQGSSTSRGRSRKRKNSWRQGGSPQSLADCFCSWIFFFLSREMVSMNESTHLTWAYVVKQGCTDLLCRTNASIARLKATGKPRCQPTSTMCRARRAEASAPSSRILRTQPENQKNQSPSTR